jgi:hypothetical protein
MRKRVLTWAVVFFCGLTVSYLLHQFILDQQVLAWSDYKKVQDGMTLQQVESVLGSPTEVSPKPDGGKEVRWFGRNHGMIYVEFDENGAMVRKNYTEDACDSRLRFFPPAVRE